ncbi:hypothetical protein INN71_07935 [Nocardioides sp. ChNu-153]|uniref:hypothetical protein n=1 Tax=unclassified Nocardioides TaxID=2615069 RepID=UPI00240733B8|nr:MULTISPECIES: hypothetical protein [unclassified Nocardioides]MDF9718011.1 hypothetical protein [Nocardioides sp. ChNu-99]MDN7121321.1 hypothetical protein [Nocardioides sp. ChNu-153]
MPVLAVGAAVVVLAVLAVLAFVLPGGPDPATARPGETDGAGGAAGSDGAVELRVDGPTSLTYGRVDAALQGFTAYVAGDVGDEARVEVSGVGEPTTLPLSWSGRAHVRPDPALGAGPHEVVATLDTAGGEGDGLRATHAFEVRRAESVVGASFIRPPTTRDTGLLLVAPFVRGLDVTPPQPDATVSVKVYLGTDSVWSSGTLPVTADGTVVVRVPVLRAGDYRLAVGYGGSANLEPGATVRGLRVR